MEIIIPIWIIYVLTYLVLITIFFGLTFLLAKWLIYTFHNKNLYWLGIIWVANRKGQFKAEQTISRILKKVIYELEENNPELLASITHDYRYRMNCEENEKV